MQQMVICLQGQCTKTPEAITLRLTQEFCGCCSLTLRVSAIRLSSGSERAFISRISLEGHSTDQPTAIEPIC
jgi:hypothetical protein